jgi:MFS family permease
MFKYKICSNVMQIIGLGAMIITPVIGNLSDEYGRKALLTVPITLSIIPLGALSFPFLS